MVHTVKYKIHTYTRHFRFTFTRDFVEYIQRCKKQIIFLSWIFQFHELLQYVRFHSENMLHIYGGVGRFLSIPVGRILSVPALKSNIYISFWRVFSGVGGSLPWNFDYYSKKILPYVVLTSITNEREDILKFFFIYQYIQWHKYLLRFFNYF